MEINRITLNEPREGFELREGEYSYTVGVNTWDNFIAKIQKDEAKMKDRIHEELNTRLKRDVSKYSMPDPLGWGNAYKIIYNNMLKVLLDEITDPSQATLEEY